MDVCIERIYLKGGMIRLGAAATEERTRRVLVVAVRGKLVVNEVCFAGLPFHSWVTLVLTYPLLLQHQSPPSPSPSPLVPSHHSVPPRPAQPPPTPRPNPLPPPHLCHHTEHPTLSTDTIFYEFRTLPVLTLRRTFGIRWTK